MECSIADSGIGISQEDIPNIFGKFQQFSRFPGGGEKGTGLGLSITKGLVGLHSGKIWVESEPVRGSKFTFSLPKYDSEALFKEYVDEGIKEAEKNNTKMSVIVLSLGRIDELKQRFSVEELRGLLKDIEGLARNTLRRHGDVAVRDTGEMIIVLPGCDKDKSLKILDRIKGIVTSDLVLQDFAGKIKVHLGLATYPDEGRIDAELIDRARKQDIG